MGCQGRRLICQTMPWLVFVLMGLICLLLFGAILDVYQPLLRSFIFWVIFVPWPWCASLGLRGCCPQAVQLIGQIQQDFQVRYLKVLHNCQLLWVALWLWHVRRKVGRGKANEWLIPNLHPPHPSPHRNRELWGNQDEVCWQVKETSEHQVSCCSLWGRQVYCIVPWTHSNAATPITVAVPSSDWSPTSDRR